MPQSIEEEEVEDAYQSDASEYISSEIEYIASENSTFHGSQLQSPLLSSVNLTSPSIRTLNIPDTEESDDENDVQILTAAEAAAEAAQKRDKHSTTFRKRKRPGKMETKPEPTECTICCEACTIGGCHRLVVLKCGHLFGKKCIERWMNEEHSTCPNCNAIVDKLDIRPLFTDHVAVVDNSGLVEMTKKYQEEKLKNSELEKDIKTLKTHFDIQTKEVLGLNMELIKLKKDFALIKQKMLADATTAVSSSTVFGCWLGASSITSPRQTTVQRVTQSQSAFSQETAPYRTIDLPVVSTMPFSTEDTFAADIRQYKPIFDVPLLSARVFSIHRTCSFLCIGEKFDQDSHGVMLVVTQDPKYRLHVPVHSSAVRDICVHPINSSVLTVAFDGKLAVTDCYQKKVILEVSFPAGKRQGWSCCFSESDHNAMYCGFQDGTVAKYDMRKPTAGDEGIVQTFSLPERQPVHSIKLFKSDEGRSTEGLAAATFHGLSVWNDVTNILSEDDTPINNDSAGIAPFLHVPSDQAYFSLSSNQLHTDQVVISSRSTPMKHSVFDLCTIGSGQLVPKMEFAGHKTASVLSRSALWTERNGSSVVASWSHDIERVTLWNGATHREVYGPEPTPLSMASAAVPVVDIQHAVVNNDWNAGKALFGTMTSRQLCVFCSS
ncbi:unnamed protein product [Peronospora farinosa]|uniref:RING-type E3 ubiquitin transferase n=1 Tax=Peronospora farinosa TaxID=134698 RepID=A0AAV0SXJ6_9STRA|nr:unnamed protein product [Peronospora farinosa]CAI5710401.1 unnamed protein product [Peronospora farinosa]